MPARSNSRNERRRCGGRTSPERLAPRPRLDQLNRDFRSRRNSQPSVTGHKHRGQRFGQRQVNSVICAEVGAELPDSIEERLVRIAFDIEAAPAMERQSRRPFAQRSPRRVSAQHMGNLHVNEMRYVNDLGLVGQPRGEPLARRGMQQKFDGAGSIENHQRKLRSRRRTSAGAGSRTTSGCERIASSNSWRLGRASALSVARKTYCDIETPSIAALAFSRRCNDAGTLRI